MFSLLKGIPILSEVVGIGKTYLEGVTEEKKAKTQAKVAVLKEAAKTDSEYVKRMTEASMSSWKDEYWTIILSIPAIMAFVPSLAPYVSAGFKALGEAPEWYMWSLMTAIMASFGLKGVKSILGKK